jgi:Ca2+-transporting ATPase
MQQSLQSPVWQKDTAAPRQPSLQQLYAQFQTSEKGLTSEEARKRLSTYGPNEPTSVKRLTTLQRLLVFVTNLLVLILLEKGCALCIVGSSRDARPLVT